MAVAGLVQWTQPAAAQVETKEEIRLEGTSYKLGRN